MDIDETLDSGEQTAEQTTDAFQDGFDSETDGAVEETAAQDSAQETAPETPASAGEEAEEEPEAAGSEGTAAQNQKEQEPAGQPAPRTWTLDLGGQSVTLRERDMIGLAQKGAGYDALAQAYEEARPMAELIADFAQRAGMTPAQYMTNLRAQMHQAKGMSQEEARRTVELEDRERTVRAAEERRQREQAQAQARQNQEAALAARRQAEVREFVQVFPNAAQNFQQIPREVWQGVQQGLSLTAAYAMYQQSETARHAREQALSEQAAAANVKNAARSTGSQRSAGNGLANKDPFLEGFDNG